jgi:transcriptional regulator with XRE-family HTH domain
MKGLELQEARERLGVSHRELAEYADVTPNDIVRWEQCEDVPPEFDRELRVALWALTLDAALSEAGLPECGYLAAREPTPDERELEGLRRHLGSCSVCSAHQRFVAERLGEPPLARGPVRLGGRVRRLLNTLRHWHRAHALGVVQAAFLGRGPGGG